MKKEITKQCKIKDKVLERLTNSKINSIDHGNFQKKNQSLISSEFCETKLHKTKHVHFTQEQQVSKDSLIKHKHKTRTKISKNSKNLIRIPCKVPHKNSETVIAHHNTTHNRNNHTSNDILKQESKYFSLQKVDLPLHDAIIPQLDSCTIIHVNLSQEQKVTSPITCQSAVTSGMKLHMTSKDNSNEPIDLSPHKDVSVHDATCIEPIDMSLQVQNSTSSLISYGDIESHNISHELTGHINKPFKNVSKQFTNISSSHESDHSLYEIISKQVEQSQSNHEHDLSTSNSFDSKTLKLKDKGYTMMHNTQYSGRSRSLSNCNFTIPLQSNTLKSGSIRVCDPRIKKTVQSKPYLLNEVVYIKSEESPVNFTTSTYNQTRNVLHNTIKSQKYKHLSSKLNSTDKDVSLGYPANIHYDPLTSNAGSSQTFKHNNPHEIPIIIDVVSENMSSCKNSSLNSLYTTSSANNDNYIKYEDSSSCMVNMVDEVKQERDLLNSEVVQNIKSEPVDKVNIQSCPLDSHIKLELFDNLEIGTDKSVEKKRRRKRKHDNASRKTKYVDASCSNRISVATKNDEKQIDVPNTNTIQSTLHTGIVDSSQIFHSSQPNKIYLANANTSIINPTILKGKH